MLSVTGTPLARKLLFQTGGTLMFRIAGLAIAFACSVVVARVLAPAEFGVYSYALSVVTLLALVPQVGIPVLLMRETARCVAAADWPVMRGLWGWATRWILLVSLGTSLVVTGLLMSESSGASGASARPALLVGLLLGPLIALSTARSSALVGLQRVVLAQLPDLVLRPTLLIVLILGAWTIGSQIGALQAMVLHVLAAFVAFLVGAVLLWRAKPPGLTGVRANVAGASVWRRSSWTLGVVGGLQLVSGEIGLILVGLLRPDVDTGVYKVALSMAALGGLGLSVFAQVLAPYIVRLHADAEDGKLQRLLAAGAWGAVALTVPFVVLVWLGGRWLVSVIYGHAYASAAGPLLTLALTYLVGAAFGLTATTLSMTGHERSCLRWLALAALFNVGFSVVLLPTMGIMAAALAQLGSTLIWSAGFRYEVRTLEGLETSLASGSLADMSQVLDLIKMRVRNRDPRQEE